MKAPQSPGSISAGALSFLSFHQFPISYLVIPQRLNDCIHFR
jgi:hypothetical protein